LVVCATTAPYTLTMPWPYSSLSTPPGAGVAVASSRRATSAAVSFGNRSRTRAATPLAYAAA
jgi:hypothetical protein